MPDLRAGRFYGEVISCRPLIQGFDPELPPDSALRKASSCFAVRLTRCVVIATCSDLRT